MKRFRAELVAVVLALGIAFYFSLHVLHFSHRNDADREVWQGLWFWQTLEAFEYRLYDARFAARGAVATPSLDKIAIIGIDELTLQSSSWPMPRANFAKVIRRLKAAGARVIAIDVDFSSPQNSRDDATLEKAMQDAGNVLLISYLTPESIQNRKGGSDAVLLRVTTPLDRFDQHTPDLALVYVPLDSDGRVRRYPLYGVINDATVGSLAALCAASYQKILDGDENKNYEKLLKSHRWPSLDKGVLRVPLVASRKGDEKKNASAPVVFSTPLYFFGPEQTFATDSFVEVLKGGTGEYSDQGLKQKFGGKIVFIGATTHFLKDTFEAPAFESHDIEQTKIPGVELNATATAMLLDGVYVRSMSTSQTLWLLFGLTLGISVWAASLRVLVSRAARGAQLWWTRMKWRGQVHSFTWFSLYLLLGALPLLVFWLVAVWLFAHRNLWVITAYPMLSAGGATGVVLLFLFGIESAERRKTQAYFSRIVSPELMAKMLASGEDYLQPEELCVTILFTDLEGFTTYSESHPPDEVIEVTNDFLSSVVPVIYRHGGWVDKYIGDAIMAVFNWPVADPGHAERALRCAVEMQEAALEWRRKTGIAFYMRVGIHTGEVIAGNMGSKACENCPERMDITVIGDTVNLASRLEGKNKEFGSWIMCSADTFKAAPGVVAAQNVSASIKGKSAEVEVYIVTGLKNDPKRDKYWAKNAT